MHGHLSEDLLHQLEQMRIALENSQADADSLEQEITRLRSEGRQRHSQLLDELGRALQSRDAVAGSLQRLEAFCHHNNWDIRQIAKFKVIFISNNY